MVEPCVALGAESKPKSWSKYATDSSAYKKINQIEEESSVVKKKDDKKQKKEIDGDEKKKTKPKKLSKVEELLAPHKDDPQFVEFMKTHAKGKGIWENDWDLEQSKEANKKEKPQSDDEGSEVDEDEAPIEETPEKPAVKLADTEISDADYMKSLQQKKEESAAKKVSRPSKAQEKADPSKLPDLLTIKIRNIPFKTKRQDVLNFFKPLKPFSVRLPTQVHGIVYVGFKLETDFKKAMLKDRSFWSEYWFNA